MPNANFTPPPNEIWYRLTIQKGINRMSGMGSKPKTRERGAVVVEIFVPENDGTLNAVRQADSLSKHLGYYRDGFLELMTPSTVNVPFDTNLSKYKLNVRVPYRYK